MAGYLRGSATIEFVFKSVPIGNIKWIFCELRSKSVSILNVAQTERDVSVQI